MTDRDATGTAAQSDLRALAAQVGAEPALISDLTVLGQDAAALIDSAVRLSSCDSAPALNDALDINLRLWVAIKAAVSDETNALPPDVKRNLLQLAKAVTEITFAAGHRRLETTQLELLVDINVNVAAGLSEAQKTALIRERARELWQQAGSPPDRLPAFQDAAEHEIAALLRTAS